MSTTNPALKERLRTELNSRYSLNPTNQWLTSFLSTLTKPPPLPALTSTARFRLISTDITTCLVACSPYVLPVGINDVQVKSATLQSDVPVQVLNIRDVSMSNYAQIEGIERVERGEEVRGREVIRNVPGATNDEDGITATAETAAVRGGSGNVNKGSTGPHKLLLQDAAGTKIWAFELGRVEAIAVVNTGPMALGAVGPAPVDGVQIGCKLVLKQGMNVRRGIAMLMASNTVVLGGKVEAWDVKWREGRKGRLQGELNATVAERG